MNYFEIIRRRRESVCNNKCEPIELMHDYVSSVLESHDLQMCQTVYLSLVNHDYQRDISTKMRSDGCKLRLTR